jgi:predicted Holliday junction resolvase-like endonuclease
MASLKQLPEVTLHTIQGSANSHKGKFGELIGYINLKAQYDRIIPLGSIVDFMAITYPRDGKPGKIDFIDIKTGENARLTKDQRAMKQLLINKNINFVTMKIDSIEGMDDGPDTDRSAT